MRISLQFLKKSIEGALPAAAGALAPALEYPLCPTPRIAVLGTPVQEESGVHCLPGWTAGQLARLRPMALAGSWDELSTVARLMKAGHLSLPELRYPIIAFTLAGAPCLSEEQHQHLWNWFRVPVFEQIRTLEGKLIAVECDARAGFHLAEGAEARELGGPAIATGIGCRCGQNRTLYRMDARRAATAGG